MLKIKTIGKPQISPDGLHVLFSIMEIKDDVDKKGDFTYVTQLYLGEIKSKSYRALTSGKYSISSPSWSPDGRSILFSRDVGNKSQAYIMKLNGGEPMALTTSSRGVINPVWSKDGQFVFYQERKSMKEFLLDSLNNPSKLIPSWNIEKPKLDANVYTFSSKANPNGSLNAVRAYLYQTEKDKKGLLQALLDDRIDIITTDHAPHTMDEKQRPYFQSMSGAPIVQHSLNIMMEFYKQGAIPLEKIVEKMCHHVAEAYRIKDRGYIREGYYADMVLVDLNQEWVVNSQNILYKCQWSPFENECFKSKIMSTFVNGNLVFENGKFHEQHIGKRLAFSKIR